MAQTARLRNEVESFQHFIFNTIDSIVAVLDGVSAEELNWRPIAPATNSLDAIATHVLGNARRTCSGRFAASRTAVTMPPSSRPRRPPPTPSARDGSSLASALQRVS